MSLLHAPPNFEVTTRSEYDETLIFTADSEEEAVVFAIKYAHRHPAEAVKVVEEHYDPNDRLFKTRRIWARPATGAGQRWAASGG